jgi:molecular chaperone GrpE
VSESDSHEPVTVTDKRRVDPETGAVRETASAPAPGGPEQEVGSAAAGAPEKDEAAELVADLQRVQADFANYRKRSLRDQQVASERAKAHVVTQFLPVLDDLERARAHGDLESGPLKAVADKLAGVLEGLGLTPFGSEGDPFDPELHEAVQHEGDGSNPVLGTVMRQGYRLGEQVVRHAMVGVVDAVSDEPEGDGQPVPPAGPE